MIFILNSSNKKTFIFEIHVLSILCRRTIRFVTINWLLILKILCITLSILYLPCYMKSYCALQFIFIFFLVLKNNKYAFKMVLCLPTPHTMTNMWPKYRKPYFFLTNKFIKTFGGHTQNLLICLEHFFHYPHSMPF